MGFSASISCLGEAPEGACCDLSDPDAPTCSIKQEIACTGEFQRYQEGAFCVDTCTVDGTSCETDDDCAPSVCKQTGAACSTDTDCNAADVCESQHCATPEESIYPACGVSACCTPPNFMDGIGCVDLTEEECLAIEDEFGNPAIWNHGEFCDESECSPWQCQYATGFCDVPHGGMGCGNKDCCDPVCNADEWCCEVQWDETCALRAMINCEGRPSYDECYQPDEMFQAMDIGEPVRRCGGVGASCESDDDCDFDPCLGAPVFVSTEYAFEADNESVCCPFVDPFDGFKPGVWVRFVAPDDSMTIRTTLPGFSPASVPDTIIEVRHPADTSSLASECESAITLGCDDDSGIDELSELHLHDLTPGDTYYLMLASKGFNGRGIYGVTFDWPAEVSATGPVNNDCRDALPIASDSVPQIFALLGATADCPVEICPPVSIPGDFQLMQKDAWFYHTDDEDGFVRIDTCSSEPTSVVVYKSEACPREHTTSLVCSAAGEDECYPFGRDVFYREAGANYLIRVGSELELDPFGQLTLTLEEDCQGNGQPDSREILFGQSEDLNENLIPDECESCEVMSSPLSGAIDARVPHGLHDEKNLSWSTMIASDLLSCVAMAQAEPFDFEVHTTGEAELTVQSVDIVEGGVEVTLNQPIEVGHWTQLVYVPTGDEICISALPGDVNGDGEVDGMDVWALPDAIAGNIQLPPFAVDIDRDNAMGPEDLLRLIDLMNGAQAFAPWFGASLPISPCD